MMIEGFYEWIRNIVFYLLLLSILNQLLPEGVYKKYMKVSSGLILMIIAVWPLLKLGGGQQGLSYFLELENVKISAVPEALDIQDIQRQQAEYVTAQYQKNLQKQVLELFDSSSLYAVSADIEIEEDTDSPAYGRILELQVIAAGALENLSRAVEPVAISVETVEVQNPENPLNLQEPQNSEKPSNPQELQNPEKSPDLQEAPSAAGSLQLQQEAERMKKVLADYFYMDINAVDIQIR